jgi:NADH:ubiquinone reductase (H+-translocating)
MKHIVIVGGGFGGVTAARRLSAIKGVHITLISDSATFRYSPALYRVATGYKRQQAVMSLPKVLGYLRDIEFVEAKITKIDRKKKQIFTSDNKHYAYDYAVLSLGVVTTYFGIPGIEEYAYGIKTPGGLREFHTHLHQELIDHKKPDPNYMVVGGGPTGVELAAGLTYYLRTIVHRHHLRNTKIRIDLVEAADRILPTMSARASRLATRRLEKLGVTIMTGQKVESETSRSLHVNGKSIPTQTVVWTAGVTNNPFYKENEGQFIFSKRGKIVVDEFLTVDESVYVIGDNAETPHSGMAQVAIMQAEYVGEDLARRLGHVTRKPYHDTPPTYVVPVGKKWAILQRGPVVFGGAVAAMMRSFADLIGYADVLGWGHSFRMWLQSDDLEETCEVCRLAIKQERLQ